MAGLSHPALWNVTRAAQPQSGIPPHSGASPVGAFCPPPPAGTHPETGRPCAVGLILMPRVEGGELQALLERVAAGRQPKLAEGAAVLICGGVLNGTAELQRQGIVHG